MPDARTRRGITARSTTRRPPSPPHLPLTADPHPHHPSQVRELVTTVASLTADAEEARAALREHVALVDAADEAARRDASSADDHARALRRQRAADGARTRILLSLERGKAAEELKLRVAEASREHALRLESLRDRHESQRDRLFASELERARAVDEARAGNDERDILRQRLTDAEAALDAARAAHREESARLNAALDALERTRRDEQRAAADAVNDARAERDAADAELAVARRALRDERAARKSDADAAEAKLRERTREARERGYARAVQDAAADAMVAGTRTGIAAGTGRGRGRGPHRDGDDAYLGDDGDGNIPGAGPGTASPGMGDAGTGDGTPTSATIEDVVRARLREAADALALENASLRSALASAGGAKPRAAARTATDPSRRPRTAAAFVTPQKNALATAWRPEVGRVVGLSPESMRRRDAPLGRSQTAVASRGVGSATRRALGETSAAGANDASACRLRVRDALREAAAVGSAVDASLERARTTELALRAERMVLAEDARRTERALSRRGRAGTDGTGRSARARGSTAG